MSVDFPRAWEISRAVPKSDHASLCSFAQTDGGLLCDCDVLMGHSEVLDSHVFYSAGGKVDVMTFTVDRHKSGYFLLRMGAETFPAGPDELVVWRSVERLRKAHRPNLEVQNGNLMVCWNEHDKGQPCEYEVLIYGCYQPQSSPPPILSVSRVPASDLNHSLLNATMAGYVAGIADGVTKNPYMYIQEEAWCWEHGKEQGRQHRVRCNVFNRMN